MFLKNIELTNFRNFEHIKFDFDNLNIFSGPNGRGKTNILEAIYLLSSTKSFRSSKNRDLVLWGEEFNRIEANIQNSQKTKLEFIIDLRPEAHQPKIVKIDEKKRKLFFILGKLKTVLFSPESLNIILGSPQTRRRFLDFLICQQEQKYAKYLLYLKEVLKNRNALLFRISQHRAESGELDFWDQELVKYGSLIILRRGELIEYFNKILSKKYQAISGKNQELRLEYRNKIFLHDIEELQKNFKSKIALNRQKEIIMQKTLIGPQRDNIVFKIDNKNLSGYGSRGEIRSTILALKLGEIEFLKDKSDGDSPVFLLDDVFSELDEKRREYLSNMLDKTQTILTNCDIKTIPKVLRSKAKIFEL